MANHDKCGSGCENGSVCVSMCMCVYVCGERSDACICQICIRVVEAASVVSTIYNPSLQ